MAAYTKLPATHKGKVIACIELEKSRVLSRLIKTVSAVLAVILFVIGYLLMPIEALLGMEDLFFPLIVLMLGMMAVSLVHELLRGFLMRLISGEKPVIRYAGSYPHAACDAYFDRFSQQILNILPPIAVIAMALAFVLLAGSEGWKWIAWLIFTVAVCSGVRDAYVAWRLTMLPADILVMNVGPTYLVYSEEGTEG